MTKIPYYNNDCISRNKLVKPDSHQKKSNIEKKNVLVFVRDDTNCFVLQSYLHCHHKSIALFFKQNLQVFGYEPRSF